MKKILALAALIASTLGALAQGTAFTYQGRLNSGTNPASGVYDFKFALQASNGAQVGQTVGSSGVVVSNGLFTVTLDFGNQFPGAARLLEIAVQTNGGSAFITLAPPQPLTPTPYAITASNLSGTLPLAQLPAAVVTNGAGGVNLTGTFTGNGAGVTNVNAATLGGISSSNFWQLNGNNVGVGQFLGSTNNQPLELRVNNQRGLRLETGESNSVNVIGGWSGNSVAAGVAGATVAGGGGGNFFGSALTNRVDANFGTVSGGGQNTIQTDADYATLGGGILNTIQTNASYATLGGGFGNTIQTNAFFATLGGGYENTIQPLAQYSTLGGGVQNTIQRFALYATIGGGGYNTIQTNGYYSTIGGGVINIIQTNSYSSTIGGGTNNTIQANSYRSTIGGGYYNTIQTYSIDSTIGGGAFNTIQPNSPDSTIAGGGFNTIQLQSSYSTIGGGGQNTILANSAYSTIGGGSVNYIKTNSPGSTIGGGDFNTIQTNSPDSTIGGGYGNTIQPNSSSATIPGGRENTATNFAFAAGSRAKAVSTGAFVWADSQDADFSSTADNQFLVRAAGGVGINTSNPVVSLTVDGSGIYNAIGAAAIAVHNTFTNKTWEWHVLDDGRMQIADLTANATRLVIDTAGKVGIGTATLNNKLEVAGSIGATAFNNTSDRNAKENFAAVSAQEILAKVAALPITRWNFKQETGTAHIGPMAQDFYSAFGTGMDDRHIATVDADGVALAAIQGLNRKAEEKDVEIQELKARLDRLEQLLNTQSRATK